MYRTEIEVMQHNLIHIRKSLNMSAIQFGEMIGLTRQSINNIESGRHKLSQTQHLAILYVLEKQIFPKLDAEQKINIEKLLTDKVANRNYFDSLSF